MIEIKRKGCSISVILKYWDKDESFMPINKMPVNKTESKFEGFDITCYEKVNGKLTVPIEIETWKDHIYVHGAGKQPIKLDMSILDEIVRDFGYERLMNIHYNFDTMPYEELKKEVAEFAIVVTKHILESGKATTFNKELKRLLEALEEDPKNAKEGDLCYYYGMLEDDLDSGYLLRVKTEFSILGLRKVELEYWNNKYWLYVHDDDEQHAITGDYFYRGKIRGDGWVRIFSLRSNLPHIFDEFNEKVVSKYEDKIRNHTLSKEEFRDIVLALIDYIDEKLDMRYHDIFFELKHEIKNKYNIAEGYVDYCSI